MSLKKLLPLSMLCLVLTIHLVAQDKWDLKRCVEYAVNNNVSVKQQDVQARIAALTYKQYKLNQIPLLSVQGNLSFNSGYTQNPQDFTLSTSSLYYNSYAVQSSVTLYNFSSLHNGIAGSKLAWQAQLALTEKMKNDISLNVANAYLSFLLSNEQAGTAALQLSFSKANLENTEKLVRAGSVPELNAAELESQLAQDSSAYVAALSQVQQQIIALKGYMSYDAAADFNLDTPPVDQIPVDNILDLQPDNVYALALLNQPLQKSDKLNIKAASKYVAANKGAMYPTLTAFGSLGSTYTNQTDEFTGGYKTITPPTSPTTPPLGLANVNGTFYPVYQAPYLEPVLTGQPFFSQLNTAFRQTLGLSLNIPILNGGSLRVSYEKSKLNLRNTQLQLEADNLTLKQNIFQAYQLSVAAFQKFEAQKKTVDATERSFDFAQKRYKVGLLNTIDLLTNQNNYFKAKNDLLYDEYDYVFKMKVLEFYKGMGIKL
jgi:outer membrane protein